MKRILFGLLFLIGFSAQAQIWSGTQVQISQFGRLKRLTVKPATPADGFLNFYNLNDSLHAETDTKDWNLGKILYQDSLGSYYLKTETDSMLLLKADKDSLAYYYTKVQSDSLITKVMDTVSLLSDSLSYYYLKPQVDSIGNKIMDTVWLYVDSVNLLQDTTGAHNTRLIALERKTTGQDIWQKDSDSTTSAKYPPNISSLRFPVDSRVIVGNLANVNSAYGDTLSIGYILSGEYIFRLFGISDGAGRVWKYGMKVSGVIETDDLFVTDSLQAKNIYATDTIKAPYYRITTGAANGKVMKSDAYGNLTLQDMYSAYKGTWNANANTPTLADGAGNAGDWYIVSVGDTINLGSGNIIFLTGGTAIYNGTTWEAVNPYQSVTMVNSLIGNVQLDLHLSGDTLWITGATDSLNLETIPAIGNLQDSTANHTVRFYQVLDSLGIHSARFYQLLDSIAVETGRYYVILDSLDVHRDTLTAYRERIEALEGKTGDQDIWQKDPDSTASAKYPINQSALKLPADSRVVVGNLANVNAQYGDTLSIGYIISGQYIMNLFGISDGAGRILKYGVKLRGTLYADAVAGAGFQGIRDSIDNLNDSLAYYRLLTNHDSLSMLDEKSYNSLTDKPDLSIYAGKDTLALYRKLTNHDSLGNLDERSYNSLTDKPTIPTVTPANVTAGSTKITLGGTPTGAALQAFSVDVDQSKVDHNSLLNYIAGKHYYQQDIDTVNTTLSGLLKSTSGLLSTITDSSAYWKIAYDSVTPYDNRLDNLEGHTLAQSIWQKDPDSTTSALYPVNLSALDMPSDSRVIFGNVANVNAAYGDTLSIGAIINGALMQFFGVSDGAGRTISRGLKIDGDLIADSIPGYIRFSDTTSLVATKYDLDTLTILTVTPSAMTKVDDTNVTLTLGGTPATSLLQATSLTLGWTGILGSARGGTGNGFTKFTGPTTSEKTFTLPNANAVLARTDAGQTFTGVNTMADSLLIPDIAYSTQTWNNSSAPPTKNAVRDKIEALAAGKFIVQGTTNSHLPGAQFLGALGTGIVKNTTTSGILSIIPDNSANWDAAYNDKINSASWSTSTGILTLNQQDAGTVTVDLDGRYLTTSSAYQPLFPNVVNDITLANQYNKVFSKPVNEYVSVSGPDRPHASLIVDDYYFVLDREYPAFLLRFDPDDLSSGASTVTFPTATPYGSPEQMIYLPSKGMIYIYFARAGTVAIVEVNPSTLAYSTVITFGDAAAIAAGPMVSDGTYLYFTTNGDAGSTNAEKVYQYRLSDWAYINNATITGAATDYPHAIAYDGNALYISTTSYDVNSLNKIYRVDLPGLTLNASSVTTYAIMCDEMVVTGDKLYVGKETSDGHILVIDKPGYGIAKDSIYTGISAPCYGVFFDGFKIYATMAGSPGGLSRIDPYSGEVSYMTFPSGYNNANELSFHGGRMLVTFYQTNFGIGRICLPEMISVAHGSLTNPMTTSQDMIVGGASGVPTRLAKGNDGDVLSITSGTVGWVASGGGGMVYPGAGIPISTGSAWGTSIDNNSINWNTAYTWGNHASAGYALTTGKLSQFASTSSAELAGVIGDETGTDKLVYNTSPTFYTGIALNSTGVASFNTDKLQLWGDTEGKISSKEDDVLIGVKDGGGDFEAVMKANYNAGNSKLEANYNGSKVFETTSSGVNIANGKVYQADGFSGTDGTYTNATVTVKGGIVISASSGTESPVLQSQIPLTKSEVNNLNTTPKVLVAAQGAGTYIQVLSAVAIWKGQKIGSGDIGNHAHIANAGAGLPQMESGPFLYLGANQTFFDYVNATGVVDNIIENAPLILYSTGASTFGGDGTLEIIITYKVITP